MTVISVKVGAATTSTAVVVTEVTSVSAVRVAVATNPGLVDAIYHGPVTPATQGAHFVAKVDITGLNAETRYYYQVEHAAVLNTTFPGQFITNPTPNTPASFTVWMGGDGGLSPASPGIGAVLASNRMTNHPIYETIRGRAVDNDWLFGFHMGDEHYYDLTSGSHGIVGGPSLANYRRAKSDVQLQTNQHALNRSVPMISMWDDHDFLGNDLSAVADPVAAARCAQVYREREPHYPLETSEGVYFSHQVGRVLFVVLDSRYYASANADPNDANKTMLGTAQKAWMLSTLAATSAKFIVVVGSRQWTRTDGIDTWASFPGERQELADLFTGLGLADRMCMVYADRHAVKLMATQPWGGFPVMLAAPFDADGGSPEYDYPDGLPDDPGSSHSQYGTLAFDDDGERIVATMTIWRGLVELASQTITVETPAAPVVPSRSILQALTAGSHQIAIEARVVTTYQDGDDPDGTEIPVLTGGVVLDGTADIYGTLTLTTDGDGMWPQRASDLLSPFGNEIFVRRGVYADSTIVWVPLGYYRIQDPDQPDAPDGPITITGLDRMAGLIDARLLAPRQYAATQTVRFVFDDLVREIYPDATILFDDTMIEFSALGRAVASEDSRYEMLREIADAYGKIMYWDTSGVLRVESAPDPAEPVWNFMAGRRDGVLLGVSRALSRDGVYNAVVASGEGTAGDIPPVRGVAFDDNPASPTYFFGRFNQVPRFYTSPLIVSTVQAVDAARAMLSRNLGFPYNVAFTISPNPAVRPFDPVKIMLRDGEVNDHVVEAITIPLDAAIAMTGRTRQKTIIAIGST